VNVREEVDQSLYQVVETKKNIKVNGHFLHHPKRPEFYAKKYAKDLNYAPHCLVVLYGVGRGYEIKELLKRLQPHDKIIVVEPLHEVLKIFAKNNLELLRKNPIRAVSTWDQFRECYMNCGDWQYLIYCVNPTYHTKIFKDHFEEFKEKVHREVSNLQVDGATTRYFCVKWQENVLRNINSMGNIGNAGVAKDAWKGRPAIICSAGPSLADAVPHLPKAKGKALILHSQTTNRLFEGAETKPDLMFSFDADYSNWYEHFSEVNDPDIPMVFDPALYWRCVRDWKGKKSMLLVHPANGWIEDLLEDKFKIAGAGPSIACTMLDFAYKAGAEPIIFVGQDLAYTGGRFHAAGTHASEEWDSAVPPERQVASVEGKDGEPVLTDINMKAFLHWFEESIPISFPNRKIINCTTGGANIRGMENADFEETIKKYCTKKLPVKALVNKMTKPVSSSRSVGIFFKDLSKHLHALFPHVVEAIAISELLLRKYHELKKKAPKVLKDKMATLAKLDDKLAKNQLYLRPIHYVIRPWLGSHERPLDPVHEEVNILRATKGMYAELRGALEYALPIIEEESHGKRDAEKSDRDR
jgi:hypothetical protein